MGVFDWTFSALQSALRRVRMKHVIIETFALLFLAVSGHAADLSLFIPEKLPSGSWATTELPHIKISGEIEASDVAELKKLVKQFTDTAPPAFRDAEELPAIIFDSNGGDLYAAMEIGRFLRQNHLWVDSFGNQCDSACVFAFAGGVTRVGDRFGLHRPSLPSSYFAGLSASDATSLYNKTIADCRSYLEEMGVSGELLDDMLKVTSVGARYVDWDYAERVGLVGQDPAYAEWALAKTLEKLDRPYVVAWYTFIDCMNYGIEESECQRRYNARSAAIYDDCITTRKDDDDTCKAIGPPGVVETWMSMIMKCYSEKGWPPNSPCSTYFQELTAVLSKQEAVYQGWTNR